MALPPASPSGQTPTPTFAGLFGFTAWIHGPPISQMDDYKRQTSTISKCMQVIFTISLKKKRKANGTYEKHVFLSSILPKKQRLNLKEPL